MNDLVENQNFKYGVFGQNGFIKKSANKKIELVYNEELNDKNHILYGKHVCFTGALKGFTRNEIAQTVTNIGSVYDSSVKKSTNYLVVGNLENLEKLITIPSQVRLKKQKNYQVKDKTLKF
ncbi:BRCT domain-containing protein [Staphylococcus aureus]|nr:BRCT domain-containing protein [Staphylococcus aureus]